MCVCRHINPHRVHITPQSLTTRRVVQRASNHFEEVSWKDSQFIISFPWLSLQHSSSRFLPFSPQEGGGRQALPLLNSSSSAAEDIKWGQSNPAPTQLSSHFIAGSRARGDGASKYAAAKTAATAKQKSSPKHRAPDTGNKQNGLMLAPKLEIKNTMCKAHHASILSK